MLGTKSVVFFRGDNHKHSHHFLWQSGYLALSLLQWRLTNRPADITIPKLWEIPLMSTLRQGEGLLNLQVLHILTDKALLFFFPLPLPPMCISEPVFLSLSHTYTLTVKLQSPFTLPLHPVRR